MNGPEHYAEAERLLAEAHVPPAQRAKKGWLTSDELVMAAGVHATLALAAATAAGQATAYDGDEHGSRSRGWAGVA
ncbi:MAG: hypothetical protein HOQ43_14210 [Glycomyces artemisiae]|uniref:Uncharacterized protein n=1 Tax=Glycomyces artemisiae TaxID=1076443 RepID=A0A850CCA5_9ACTN|nr:hypothetical protein [Glycomyces artemisiae]